MLRRHMPSASPVVFRYRAYSLFWTARVFTVLALQSQSITIGWQVYSVARRSNSVEQGAFLVGMVGLSQFLPMFLLTFIAGAIADRRDRRLIMMACLVLEALGVLTLALMALRPSQDLIHIFAIAMLFGAARAFLSPAQGAMGPMLVPKEVLPRAIAMNSLGSQSATIIGPWIGGALCAFSPAAAYFGSCLLYLSAFTAILFLNADTRPTGTKGPPLQLVREGLEYVWGNKIVLGAISLDLFAVLLGGATALLPVYARDILKIGPHGFGMLRSGPAIGAALMALTLSRWHIHRNAGRWMFAGVAAFGVATLVFAVSKLLWVSMIALAILGASDMISVYVRSSLVQIVTPDHMRGRVSAVSFLFIGASNELGEFETGVVARALGPVGAALFGGFGSLGVTGVWSRLFPTLRRADRLDTADART